MKILSPENGFRILWVLVSFLHIFVFIATLFDRSGTIQFGLYSYTIIIWPLRSLLIGEVLGLSLPWTRWTALGTIIGGCGAFLYLIVLMFVVFACCYMNGETEISILRALAATGFYPAFRFILLLVQALAIPKLRHLWWLANNLLAMTLVWLALVFGLLNLSRPELLAFSLIFAMTISEFLTANGYVDVKRETLPSKKRKIEEL